MPIRDGTISHTRRIVNAGCLNSRTLSRLIQLPFLIGWTSQELWRIGDIASISK
jgi:hypothetical protein